MDKQDIPIIAVPALIIIILGLYLFFKTSEYKNQPINGLEYSHLNGITPEEIQDKLVKSQEKFIGSIDYKYTNSDKTMVDIHMYNDYTGDDSVTAHNNIYTAKQEASVWKIVSIKSRWKCREGIFWTTSICS